MKHGFKVMTGAAALVMGCGGDSGPADPCAELAIEGACVGLPSAPTPFLRYFEDDSRPQTRLDRDAGDGQAISIGRLRPDALFDWRFVALSHNTVRGGVDKQCRMRIAGDQLPALVIEAAAADLPAAIDLAAERAGRTVVRARERRRGAQAAQRELEAAAHVVAELGGEVDLVGADHDLHECLRW